MTIPNGLKWIFAGLLSACLAFAQQQASPGDLANMPHGQGIYYHAGSGWSSLQHTLLWPYAHGKGKSYFNLGRRSFVAEMPGAHASSQISDARPMFYIRGLNGGASLHLVRVGGKLDYRQVNMQSAKFFEPRAPFPQGAMVDLDVTRAGEGIYSVRPRADLAPGEYLIASSPVPGQRSLLLAFDFGVRR